MSHSARPLALVALLAAVLLPLAANSQDQAREDRRAVPISYTDIEPVLDALRPHLPPELAGLAAGELRARWPEWVARRDTEIRARVTAGDEDSIVHLWLYGTSFTDLPPARPAEVAADGNGATLADVVNGRLDDFLNALASPGRNERLRFARQFFETHGLDLRSSAGRQRARARLEERRRRVAEDNAVYVRALNAARTLTDPIAQFDAHASLYRDRGLSSDTSILSSFGVEAALSALSASGALTDRPVRRVAIVGPGLDFINKAEGRDFYPQQTLQPFAVADSLIRLGLASRDDMAITTFDLSPHINAHLAAAADRARRGGAYVVQLPLGSSERWTAALRGYWKQFGDRIGNPAPALRAPRGTGPLQVRAVRIDAGLVGRVDPRDVNVVVQRLEPVTESTMFDLVIATNVFAYYGPFEQRLAMINVGRMLRPGGSLLTNQAAPPVAPIGPDVGHARVSYSDRQFDDFFWYVRK